MRQIDELWILQDRLEERAASAAQKIILYIARKADALTGICDKAVAEIAAACDYSESHTRAVIIRLASAGIIEKTPRWDRLPNGLKPQIPNALRLIRGDDDERQRIASEERQRRRINAARKAERRAQKAAAQAEELGRLIWKLVGETASGLDVAGFIRRHTDSSPWRERSTRPATARPVTDTYRGLMARGLGLPPIMDSSPSARTDLFGPLKVPISGSS